MIIITTFEIIDLFCIIHAPHYSNENQIPAKHGTHIKLRKKEI